MTTSCPPRRSSDLASLYLQRIREPGDAGLPAVLRAVDQRLVGGVEVHVAVAGRKRLLDLLDVIGDALRLPEKLLGLTNLRLKLLERGKWQAGEVFRFVDQRRRLVLERLDLIVDLLERAGRSEEHTSELQSLMRMSYAVFCLTKKTQKRQK